MATFEDVVNKAKSAAETAGKKTSDFLEATRLKADAAEAEKELAYTMAGCYTMKRRRARIVRRRSRTGSAGRMS